MVNKSQVAEKGAEVASQAKNVSDQAVKEAVNTLISVNDYSQALEIYYSLGDAIAFLVAIPFLMLLLTGIFATDKRQNNLWSRSEYWVVVVVVLISILVMLIAFPYLVMVL